MPQIIFPCVVPLTNKSYKSPEDDTTFSASNSFHSSCISTNPLSLLSPSPFLFAVINFYKFSILCIRCGWEGLCMAVRLSSLSGNEVSDLCLGKPALRSLCVTDTVADALSALKRTGDTYLSIWNCHHSLTRGGDTNTDHNNKKKREIEREKGDSIDCKCIGRVCMVDIICFLCKPENLSSPATALRSSVSLLLPDLDPNSPLVQHLQPNARFSFSLSRQFP